MLTYTLNNQRENADELGLDMVVPEPDQLLIDCDSKADELWLQHMLSVASKNNCHISIEKITTSKNKRLHYYLRWPSDLDPVKRVALQAILGSDRHRELLSLLRIEQGIENPTVLYETR